MPGILDANLCKNKQTNNKLTNIEQITCAFVYKACWFWTKTCKDMLVPRFRARGYLSAATPMLLALCTSVSGVRKYEILIKKMNIGIFETLLHGKHPWCGKLCREIFCY